MNVKLFDQYKQEFITELKDLYAHELHAYGLRVNMPYVLNMKRKVTLLDRLSSHLADQKLTQEWKEGLKALPLSEDDKEGFDEIWFIVSYTLYKQTKCEKLNRYDYNIDCVTVPAFGEPNQIMCFAAACSLAQSPTVFYPHIEYLSNAT